VNGAIPFDDPPLPILFNANCFALTGQFVYGPRRNVEAAIELRGGKVSAPPNRAAATRAKDRRIAGVYFQADCRQRRLWRGPQVRS
jgi:hypothetical protein